MTPSLSVEASRAVLARLDQLASMTGRALDEGDARSARLAAAIDLLGSRLDRLTEAAQPMTGELARLRDQQDRVAVQVNEAASAMAKAAAELRQAQPQMPPGPEVFEHMVRLGAELEGASDRLRLTSQQMTQEEQDRRGHMATLDLGLRVALTGMEAVVTGRQSEQVAQLKDAQREVIESVLEGLNSFGRRVDAGFQHATDELTTSVFLTHADSDDRSHALQEQLVDLRRVVDRLTREVQLLRPAIDLRSESEAGFLNGVPLERFADRVAALLSEEVLTRLDATPPALSQVSTHRAEWTGSADPSGHHLDRSAQGQ